jgi:hypothetical protein
MKGKFGKDRFKAKKKLFDGDLNHLPFFAVLHDAGICQYAVKPLKWSKRRTSQSFRLCRILLIHHW